MLWGAGPGDTELTGDPVLSASSPGAAAALSLGGSLQPQLQAARARLTALAVVAEGLQKQQADARAAQLAGLQASSQLQLASLQASAAPGTSNPPPVSAHLQPPSALPQVPSSGSLDSSSSSVGELGAGGVSGGQSAAGSRLSNDGSSSGSSVGAGRLPSSLSSSDEGDSVRSWASPAQLNGLDLRVPPTSAALQAAAPPPPHQPSTPPPPRRSTLDSLLERPTPTAPTATPSTAFPAPTHKHGTPQTLYPTNTPPAPPPAPQPHPSFSLFSTQLVGAPQANNPTMPPPQPMPPSRPSDPFGTASQQPFPSSSSPPLRTSPTPASSTSPAPSGAAGPMLNEVVCGALMLAYERAGKWQDTVGVLQRARALGLCPNTVMLNTAISAAGKARMANYLLLGGDVSVVPARDTQQHITISAADMMKTAVLIVGVITVFL